MELSNFQLLEVLVAISAVLMLGSSLIRRNIMMFVFHTTLLSILTAWIGHTRNEQHLYYVAVMFFAVKAVAAPYFLSWVVKNAGVEHKSDTYLPSSISMHIGILLMGISYLFAQDLPGAYGGPDALYGGMSAFSLIMVGVLMMVSRKSALSQILGFLLLENGIFLFTLAKTQGMPMGVEMGILLDVLGCVMMAGLLIFRIQKNFEHIDVTKLTGLKD